MRQAIELPLSKNNLSISRINMSIKEKKLGGRPKLASYQKRTKCFRVMFTENDYIYIQSKAEQAGLSVNEFCHQAAMDCQVCQRISPEMVSAIRDLPVSPITSIRLPTRCTSMDWKQSNNSVFRLSRKLVELSPK